MTCDGLIIREATLIRTQKQECEEHTHPFFLLHTHTLSHSSSHTLAHTLLLLILERSSDSHQLTFSTKPTHIHRPRHIDNLQASFSFSLVGGSARSLCASRNIHTHTLPLLALSVVEKKKHHTHFNLHHAHPLVNSHQHKQNYTYTHTTLQPVKSHGARRRPS